MEDYKENIEAASGESPTKIEESSDNSGTTSETANNNPATLVEESRNDTTSGDATDKTEIDESNSVIITTTVEVSIIKENESETPKWQYEKEHPIITEGKEQSVKSSACKFSDDKQHIAIDDKSTTQSPKSPVSVSTTKVDESSLCPTVDFSQVEDKNFPVFPSTSRVSRTVPQQQYNDLMAIPGTSSDRMEIHSSSAYVPEQYPPKRILPLQHVTGVYSSVASTSRSQYESCPFINYSDSTDKSASKDDVIESDRSQNSKNITVEKLEDDEEIWKSYNDFVERNSFVREYGVPATNTKERIVIVIDRAHDDDYTSFIQGDFRYTPLQMMKRAVNIFVSIKHNIDTKHEYALMVLNANKASWLHDFTNNVTRIKNQVSMVTQCEAEDIFDFGSIYDELADRLEIVELKPNIPPPFLTRIILFYGRSYTLPEFKIDEKMEDLLNNFYFTFDILMTHEPVGSGNNCEKIFETLETMDCKGFSYFLPVARDASRLQLALGKLLAHPLQRPIQKKLNCRVKM